MSLKDKLEIGLKRDAPYRADNLPEEPTPETLEQARAASARADEVGASSRPVTDAWITAKIQSKYLLAGPGIDSGIDVTTTDGVVRLAGTVPGPGERQVAEMIAANTRGVDRVINELRVVGRQTKKSDCA